jgi:hypothetical protein
MPRRATSRRPRVLDAATARRHAVDSRAYELALQDARREYPVFTAANYAEVLRFSEARRLAHRARLLADGWTPAPPPPTALIDVAPLPPMEEMRAVIGDEAQGMSDAEIVDVWNRYAALARLMVSAFKRRQEGLTS